MGIDVQDLLVRIRDPRVSLPAYGHIIDQATGQTRLWDPYSLTHAMQETVVNYIANPPRMPTGDTLWLNVLKSRQTGGSLTPAIGFYPLTAYTPGHYHVTIADKKDRADRLHDRINFLHARWPEQLRQATTTAGQTRALEFKNGAKMRTLSAGEAAAGVGQSLDSMHGSEIPLWENAGQVLGLMNPAMINRREALRIMESTPYPMDQPSAEFWRDHYAEGKRGVGRHISVMFPFWDGKLNERPWNAAWKLDTEELRLMERYASQGLRLENLAFRRFVLDNDQEFRRNPGLFQVFYPFDDTTCWQGSSKVTFPAAGLERLGRYPLRPWQGPEMRYKQPIPGARYVIGVDPAGFAVRDHAAFQVLEVWRDEVEQVACYADQTSGPNEFTDHLIRAAQHYNNALVVVESNGVGAAVLALLRAAGYNRVYYESEGKPGKATTGKSLAEMTAWLSDAVLDTLVLNDNDTYEQLSTYKNDKLTERSEAAELNSPERRGTRRERHHWDKVSALLMAMVGVRITASRDKNPGGISPVLGKPVTEWTPAQLRQWQEMEQRRLARAKQAPMRLKWKAGYLKS